MAILGRAVDSFPLIILGGEEIEFFWEKREALVKEASIEYQGLLFRSSSLSLKEGKITMENVALTTCDLPHPHYVVGARYIFLPLTDKKRKFYAKGVALYIGEKKILSLPPFRAPLNPEEREKEGVLAMPRVEFSKDMGLSLVEELSFSFREDNGRLKVGYSAKRGILGRISLPLLPYTTLNIGRYDVITGKEISPLYISEEPHILWQYRDCSLSLGKFREEPTHLQSHRLRLSLSFPLLEEKLKENFSIGILGKGAYSLYDKGRKYESIGGGISLKIKNRSSQANLYLGYLAIGGFTPFVFDKEELTSYARLDWLKEGSKWEWEASGIWDLKGSRFYDAGLTLYKKLHCLKPGISWQKRGGILQLRLKLIGF